MMKFCIAFGFKNGLDFQFSTGFQLKDQCASLRLLTNSVCFFGVREFRFAPFRPLNFSKEKKGKKRKPFVQVEGFKKASFFDKILPDTSSEVRA